MSGGGYLTVSNEAVACARRNPEFAGAILLLYANAQSVDWGPFDCADRWLTKYCHLTMRQAQDFIGLMVSNGYLEIVDPGSNRKPRMVQVQLPKAMERNLMRSKERRAERKPEAQSKPASEPIEEPPPVNGAQNGAQPGAQHGAREKPIPPVPLEPRPLDNSPPADAGAPPHWEPIPAKTRKEPSGAYHAAIRVWDTEHLTAFGVRYPWVFHGRDADGARIKSWLSAARVSEANPEPGLERLRAAFVAYFEAVKAGTAWPLGEPAITKRFSTDLAKWLRTEPIHEARAGPAKTHEQVKQRWGFGGS